MQLLFLGLIGLACAVTPRHDSETRSEMMWVWLRVILIASVLLPALRSEEPVETAKAGWALTPLTRPAVPAGTATHPVDAFILQKLKTIGLAHSPEADKRTLIRRLTVDLTGFVPTPEENDAYLKDTSTDAYKKLVDRLLDSPRYGERWARHWLDVAHYADTHGQDEDAPRENAWPYRDYLIRSFNGDKPYAKFVKEQIAGDVLYPDDAAATIATGFLAAGPWDSSGLAGIREDSLDRLIAYYLDRDDILSSTMSTFSGLTVGCARCHDHKFDPIPQSDYYNLQSIFAGINKADRHYDADPAVTRKRAELQRDLKQARVLKAKTLPATQQYPDAELFESVRTAWEQRLTGELAALPAPAVIYSGTNRKLIDGPIQVARPVHNLKRGDVTKPGEAAVAGTLFAVPGLPSTFRLKDPNNEGQRRAALAEWLAHERNPLTWRVMANRVWHYHFGKGLVDTPNDFGKMGGTPSHPELLDWLAVEFRDGGGSLKKLHRLIVTSNTYRQSVSLDPAAAAKDSDNRLLWRMNRTRLDAETVHDSVLLLSGRLHETMYGPPVRQFNPIQPSSMVTTEADYDKFDVDAPAMCRRSIYRYVFRTRPDPLFAALDCPDASQSAPARSLSVGALQALALWNNKFTLRHAEHLAAIAVKNTAVEADQVAFVVNRLYGRTPTETERTEWAAYARKHGLANLCRVLLNSSEFLFVD